MIPVTLTQPPPHYEADVKNKGAAFLRSNPRPKASDWLSHSYWRAIHNDLYSAHNGICMYSASWSPRSARGLQADGQTSVDHFVPKSVDSRLAYDWNNFRLARARLNTRKDDFQDVLDPCAISPDLFAIDFIRFFVAPAAGIRGAMRNRVEATINRLQLNRDPEYVDERLRVIGRYTLGRMAFQLILERYPFIAYEMTRQQFDTKYLPLLKPRFSSPAFASRF